MKGLSIILLRINNFCMVNITLMRDSLLIIDLIIVKFVGGSRISYRLLRKIVKLRYGKMQ
jgi:hypothetical protein